MSEFKVYKNPEAVAQAATDYLFQQIKNCVTKKDQCHVVLPGGSTPARCLELLAAKPLPWKNIHWYPGDERAYPIGHAERNDTMIMEKLFSQQKNASENFHPIPAELGPEQGAEKYASLLDAVGDMDIVILGMGEDGHTASLFPGNVALENKQSAVPVYNAPKAPDERISIGLTTLRNAAERIVITTGENKREALKKLKQGAKLPVGLVEPDVWFVDEAAASSEANDMNSNNDKLYILLVSVHGLIRGHDLELGRDADTGGQTKYVVELLRELGEWPEVEQAALLTRRIVDPGVSEDYSEPIEILSDKTRIIRIDCGEEGYLPKEALWDSLDNFADNALEYITSQDRLPDIIHSHYADAGYVCKRISHRLNIPLIHTGHSLGRSKRKQLLAGGMKRDIIEQRYNISRRIDAEEEILGTAECIITSTEQEIIEQYGMYDYYQPERMKVIPPGTDLEKFYPPQGDERDSVIYHDISRFLQAQDKPIILALSRPDHRKNINTLVEAYGGSEELKQLANLVIIAGNRDEIRDMDNGIQSVLTEIFLSIDSYDLYGKVAYPKHHRPDEVPVIYRLTAASGGVFVNPALTEPFGLTLIEAAASGLPIVATEDGGPRDIIDNCHNGYLVDPLDKQVIVDMLLKVLLDRDNWKRLARNGIDGVRQHYSWHAHVEKYLKLIKPVADKSKPITRIELKRRPMLFHDRALFTDLDQNLLGDPESLKEFVRVIQENRKCTAFGIATGRRLDSALKVLKQYHIPLPDVLITSLGTEIYYNPGLTLDVAWSNHIDHMWRRRTVLNVLKELPGLELQPKLEQSKYKISYFYDAAIAPDVNEIIHLLHLQEQSVNVVLAFGQYLDIVPVRASKGFALRWFAEMWGIPLGHILAAGGSGADEDMMRGNTLSVVVANRHNEELSELVNGEDIYFADRPFAAGILQAIEHYDFFRECKVNA